jgi:hypothetical protein
MKNLLNDSNILDIDIRFIKMLGIRNYVNPNYIEYQEKDLNIQEIVDDLNLHGLLILTFHIYVNRYNTMYDVSIELQNKINKLKIYEIENSSSIENSISLQLNFNNNQNNTSSSGGGSVSVHETDTNMDITNIYFNIYDYKLKLNKDGLINPERNKYNYIYYEFNHKKRFIDNHDHIQRLIDMFNKYVITVE